MKQHMDNKLGVSSRSEGLPLFRASMEKFAQMLMRWPWLPAAAYFLAESLTYLTLAILFANHCPSCNRFVPELSDEFAAGVCDVYDFSLKQTVVVGCVMLIAPLIPLAYKQYRTVVVMLALGVLSMLAGSHALDLVPWSCRSVLAQQMRIVRTNVARKAEAQRQGKTDWQRIPVHKFVQRLWTFSDGRYTIYQSDNTIEKDVYDLVDKRWRKNRYDANVWEDLVLVDDVVRWTDCKDRLHVVTKSGKSLVLDYATGKVTPCVSGGSK